MAGLVESQGTDLLMGNTGFAGKIALSDQMSDRQLRLALKRMKTASLVLLAADGLAVCPSSHQCSCLQLHCFSLGLALLLASHPLCC